MVVGLLVGVKLLAANPIEARLDRMEAHQAETNRRIEAMQAHMDRRFDDMEAENQRQHDAMEEVLSLSKHARLRGTDYAPRRKSRYWPRKRRVSMRFRPWWNGGPGSWPIGNLHLDGKTLPILRMTPHQARENRGVSGRRWGVLEVSGANSRISSNHMDFPPPEKFTYDALSEVE